MLTLSNILIKHLFNLHVEMFLHVCMSIPVARRYQKRVLDPLEMELHLAMSHYVGAGPL